MQKRTCPSRTPARGFGKQFVSGPISGNESGRRAPFINAGRVGTMPVISPSIKTLADLLDRLGGVPLDRIRFRPYPGTATIQDVIDIERTEDRLCELVEGVLVEKAMGYHESALAAFVGGLLNAFVIPRNLGLVSGADGTMEIMPDLVRIPDVAFTNWDRFPGRR